MITAKVQCNLKQSYTVGEQSYSTIGFCPDYTDGRNKEWANATPSLDLRMTVKGDVANQFEPGKKYTLQFIDEE